MRNRFLRIAELAKISAPSIDWEAPEKKLPKANGLYLNLIDRIQEIVETQVPEDARVLVVSKGDDDLLMFAQRTGWHFPQDSEGRYAGYYPQDDSEAIRSLEALREQGGEYFLLPQTAFWWLDHYSKFRAHLDSRYRRVWNNPDCIIFGLAEKSKAGVRSWLRHKVAPQVQRLQ